MTTLRSDEWLPDDNITAHDNDCSRQRDAYLSAKESRADMGTRKAKWLAEQPSALSAG